MDLRQSPKYAGYMQRTGWEVIKIGENKLAYKRSLGFLGSIIKVQRVKWPVDLKEIDLMAGEHRAHLVKLEPLLCQGYGGRAESKLKTKNSKLKTILKSYGFHQDNWPLIPPKTRVIDLRLSEKQLLADFSANGRRNLRKAEKAKLDVNVGDGSDFYDNWRKAARQKKLVIPSKGNFQAMKDAFGKDMVVINGYQEDVWLGGVVMLIAPPSPSLPAQAGLRRTGKKKAYYYYAAANQKGKSLRAPYLVTWNAMKIAKQKGCVEFDFDGIADSRFKATNSSAWQGFGDFKAKFGGREVTYIGSFSKYYGIGKVFGILDRVMRII